MSFDPTLSTYALAVTAASGAVASAGYPSLIVSPLLTGTAMSLSTPGRNAVKNIYWLTLALGLSLLTACSGASIPATPAPVPAAVVESPAIIPTLLTDETELTAAGLGVALTPAGLTVRPLGVEAVFRLRLVNGRYSREAGGEAGQFLIGRIFNTAPVPGMVVEARTPFGWRDAARIVQ